MKRHIVTIHSNLLTTKTTSAIEDIPQKGSLPLVVPDLLQENDGTRHEAEQVGRGDGDNDGCICPYAEVNEQVTAGYDDQRNLPEPRNIDMAASRHDKDTQHELLSTTDVFVPVEDDGVQRIIPAQPSPIPEKLLHQAVEDIPEDSEEDVHQSLQGRGTRAAQGPHQVLTRRGQATASYISETDTDQHVGRGQLGEVHGVTTTSSEGDLESTQEQGEQIGEDDISDQTGEQ